MTICCRALAKGLVLRGCARNRKASAAKADGWSKHRLRCEGGIKANAGRNREGVKWVGPDGCRGPLVCSPSSDDPGQVYPKPCSKDS